MMVTDLAVIIVSANSGHWLRPCLSTLLTHTGGARLDVVVVDSGCTDDTVSIVRREFPTVRTVSCENRGFAHGNNRGFLTTSAPYVLFLNPDTQILYGNFAHLLAELERRPEVGLVGVRSRTPEGVQWPTIRRFPSPTRMLFEAMGAERLPLRASWLGERELDPAAYERDTACDWVSGSFMLARREALLGAGLMDERFFIYCEEPDLCLRIKRAGWEVRHLPTMSILHHAGGCSLPRFIAQDAFARRQYMEKHFSPSRRRAGIAAYAVGYVLRAILGGGGRAAEREKREASRAALRVLLGKAPPPFIAPPGQAVAPERPARTAVRAAS
jgi:N-acetylglucosaminyl-diphospho-decaprenol L-rhamnosyltransferase